MSNHLISQQKTDDTRSLAELLNMKSFNIYISVAHSHISAHICTLSLVREEWILNLHQLPVKLVRSAQLEIIFFCLVGAATLRRLLCFSFKLRRSLVSPGVLHTVHPSVGFYKKVCVCVCARQMTKMVHVI